MKLTWRRVVGIAVACVILVFIGLNLWRGLGAMGHYKFTVSAWRIAAAFAAFAVLFPAYGLLWQYIMGKFGYRLGYGRSLRIWLVSQAGRYIPGKIWFALGRIYLCEQAGVPKTITTVATGLELVLVLASSIVVFGLASLVGDPSAGGRHYIWSIWLVPVMVAAVHPRFIRMMLSVLRRIGGKAGKGVAAADKDAFTLRYVDVLRMLGIYVLCWCIYGLGYYFIATSIGFAGEGVAGPRVPGPGLLPEMIGVNALSWAGGFISVITPAGLGVREGISTFLLSALVDKPYPSLIPLVARVWVTIAEVAAIGLAVVAGGKK